MKIKQRNRRNQEMKSSSKISKMRRKKRDKNRTGKVCILISPLSQSTMTRRNNPWSRITSRTYRKEGEIHVTYPGSNRILMLTNRSLSRLTTKSPSNSLQPPKKNPLIRPLCTKSTLCKGELQHYSLNHSWDTNLPLVTNQEICSHQI